MREQKTVKIICAVIVIAVAVISLDCGIMARKVQTGEADYLIMIDPGHGGMDGGASSSDGTLEKDINLAIAKQLAGMAEQYGCAAILTRETDEWLCRTEEGSIRSRKTADLKARRELIREYKPDITVSIHLNSFKEDPNVKGAQVFYPAAGGADDVLEECRSLADVIQKTMNRTFQSEEPRTAMNRDGVFLFKEVMCPTIIVECGFMSNPAEAGRLKTTEYQNRVAGAVMTGIAEFAGLEEPETIEIIDSFR